MLRAILERLISDNRALFNCAATLGDLGYLISPVTRSMNSFVANKGRSPFQAVFGRIPQVPGVNAALICNEAIQRLSAMNVDKGLRRALLRKTFCSGNFILLATEQLREAIGFESWAPDGEDVRALEDAVVDLKDSVWRDDRGLAPDTGYLEDDEDLRDMSLRCRRLPAWRPSTQL